jgi:hypothetical protein
VLVVSCTDDYELAIDAGAGYWIIMVRMAQRYTEKDGLGKG